jgi:hypothetical protein
LINKLESFINKLESSGVVLSDFLEIGKLYGVVGSGALGHGDTIPGDGISHIVIVNQVGKRLILIELLVLSILFI